MTTCGAPPVDAAVTCYMQALRHGSVRARRTLPRVLDALAGDPVVGAALGDTLLAQFIELKRDEHVAYARHVGDWELARYVSMF